MILCTGRSIDTYKMPNKPIELGYKFHCLAKWGYIVDFLPTLSKSGLHPIPSISELSDTGSAVYHLATTLHQLDRQRARNPYVDNFYTTFPLFKKLKDIGIGAVGTACTSSKDFPECLKITKEVWSKLEYHSNGGVVKDRIGFLLWVDNKPVTMMTSIHTLRNRASEVYKKRTAPRRFNPQAATLYFQNSPVQVKEIPPVINDSNYNKLGVDIADQYRYYYDTHLTTYRIWFPMFFWALEISLINSYLIFKDSGSNREAVSHKDFRLRTAWKYISSGGVGESSGSCSPNANRPTLQHHAQHVNAELPAKRGELAAHLAVSLETRSDCYLCCWRKKSGLAANSEGSDLPRSWWKCNYCDVPLCQLHERNCFLDFHSI